MQPSQNKKSEVTSSLDVLPWHPNFRNYERLPDIKVIRTTFFVSAVAVTLTLLLAAFVTKREYNLAAVPDQVSQTQQQIDHMRRPSEAAVALFKKFQTEEKRFTEVKAFLDSRPLVSPILVHLGDTLPKGIALNYFDMREKLLILRGVVRGSADMATGRASQYEAQLKGDAFLSTYVESVLLTNATRNSSSERLSFEIQIKVKASTK